MTVFTPINAYPQQFSFPGNIIYYITKNPSSILYRKLIKTCKYFFIKSKIVVTRNLSKCKSGVFWSKGEPFLHKSNFSEKVNYKLWITYSFSNWDNEPPSSISTLLTNVVKCDIKDLSLYAQTITYKEYLLLTSSRKILDVSFELVNVKNEKNEDVLIEILLEELPLIKTFYYSLSLKNPNSSISYSTAKNLLKLPIFVNLIMFDITYIPRKFICPAFDEFKKKYEKGGIYIRFVSERFMNSQNTING